MRYKFKKVFLYRIGDIYIFSKFFEIFSIIIGYFCPIKTTEMHIRGILTLAAAMTAGFPSIAREVCTVEPEYFREGDTVTVTYNPEESFLEGKIEGVYYFWRDYCWEAEDMDLEKHNDGTLTATFRIPEKTALTVWKFYDRDTVDIGGPSFLYARYVLDKDGRNMPSANIGWGFLRGENTQGLAGIPSLRNAGFDRKDDEVIRMWINYELRDNPQGLKDIFWYATQALQRDSTVSKENMKNNIMALLDRDQEGDWLNERQLMQAHQIVSSVLPDSTMRDDIEERLSVRYPDGEFFREKTARELFMSGQKEDSDIRFEEFIRRFPPERFGHDCTLYSLPGVPFEATGALPDVIEDIKAHFQTDDIYHKTVMTYGMAESLLAKKIESWENNLPENIHLAYLPNPLTGVRLRLSIYGGSESRKDAEVEEQLKKLRVILGDCIYAEEDTNLQETVGRLLMKAGKTLSAAESCTGGMISHLITSVPGCSRYYLGSVTSYDNSVKENVLGVPREIIEKYGAVSSECVAKMAEGVKRITGSDYSVATSGIAGPDGGTPEKPVGLVWIGVCTPTYTRTFSLVYKNDRKRNIERFAASALDFLRIAITKDLNI